MIIKKSIFPQTALTAEQLETIEKVKAMPVMIDEECPELTDEELRAFYQAKEIERKKSKKQNVTLRISPETLEVIKSYGKGYTSILSRIIETTVNDKEALKNFL